jgi:hypothetical protein
MRTTFMAQKILAISLAVIFISCSATRQSAVGPTGPRDLARYVLIVEETPSGQVMHTWKPLEGFDLTSFQYPPSALRAPRGIVLASTDRQAYCEGRRQQCETDCLASSSPIPVGHLRYPAYRGPWRINKGWWCEQACIKLAEMCLRGMGEWAEEFSAEFDSIDRAVDWIKNHREELLGGTVIVIAGVAFAVAVGASAGGALILVPLVLVAEDSSDATPATGLARSSP